MAVDSVSAGRDALARGAWDEARLSFERVLEVKRMLDPDNVCRGNQSLRA